MDPATWRTYLLTQAALSEGRSTPAVVRAAIEGGVDVVQLREKGTALRSRYELGGELRELTADAGVGLVVNDRVDLALAVDADGVHVGQSDLPVDVVRELLGDDAIVGCSASTPETAIAAERAGADYLGVGAVYGTTSKDVAPETDGIGPDGVARVVDAVSIPVFAIGGITTENAPAVVEAGATGVAVITEITTAAEPATAAARLEEAVANA